MAFLIQDDMWEAVEELPTQQRNEVLGALCLLAFTGEHTELVGTSKYIFIAFRERVLKLCKRHKDNIMQTSCKHNVNIAEIKENEKEKEKEKEKNQKKKKEKELKVKENCVCKNNNNFNNKDINKDYVSSNNNNNYIYINNKYNNNKSNTNNRECINKNKSNTIKANTAPQTLGAQFDTLPNSKAKPSNVDEVQTYIDQRGITTFSAQEWWDFYASKGWKIGREVMKDWKAAVRTWQYRKDTAQSAQPTHTEGVEDDFDRLARGEMPILRR